MAGSLQQVWVDPISKRGASVASPPEISAAGRHLNFTKAADELFVTQAAVSHQIKHLEEQLGTLLFRRLNRQLLLTDAGQTLLQPMTEALDLMAAGIDRLDRRQREGVLAVSTIESIAATWLVPRLAQFRERHPDIQLSLAISDHLADFDTDTADMAIRYGPGGWPRVAATKLADEEIFPVLSPALAAQGPRLETPADLLKFPLIHEDLPETWAHWFAAAGVGEAKVPAGVFLPHSNLVMQAVLAGEGVALGRSFLIKPEIAAGRLIKPFETALPAANSYYVVMPEGAGEQPKIRAFRDWIVEETKAALSS
ncbi:MAG: transcriptional regulator GcvA [Magnetovibrio sp.]|nr:transcriptional regulator GcvA [Magnetovibrio sp.]